MLQGNRNDYDIKPIVIKVGQTYPVILIGANNTVIGAGTLTPNREDALGTKIFSLNLNNNNNSISKINTNEPLNKTTNPFKNRPANRNVIRQKNNNKSDVNFNPFSFSFTNDVDQSNQSNQSLPKNKTETNEDVNVVDIDMTIKSSNSNSSLDDFKFSKDTFKKMQKHINKGKFKEDQVSPFFVKSYVVLKMMLARGDINLESDENIIEEHNIFQSVIFNLSEKSADKVNIYVPHNWGHMKYEEKVKFAAKYKMTVEEFEILCSNREKTDSIHDMFDDFSIEQRSKEINNNGYVLNIPSDDDESVSSDEGVEFTYVDELGREVKENEETNDEN